MSVAVLASTETSVFFNIGKDGQGDEVYQIPLPWSSISGDTEFIFYVLTGATSFCTFPVILLFYGPCPLGLESAQSAKVE